MSGNSGHGHFLGLQISRKAVIASMEREGKREKSLAQRGDQGRITAGRRVQ
jgi:hypothetical protein